jgi:8-oxo-dGTP pyrophosphatase MutT (NUDIX family)
MRLPREVLVVVRRDDEFLVLHRSPECDAFWHLVAGAVEPGETEAEAAARELLEETGLEAGGVLVELGRRFAYPLVEESPARRGLFEPGTREVTVECFSVDVAPDWEPTLNEEHDDYRWCDAAEADALLRWPEPRELAARLLR